MSTLRVDSDPIYLSREDERANVATHALGIVLSLLVLCFFAWQTGSVELGLTISCLVFSLCMLAVYTFSTLSHAVQEQHRRNRMRAWDQGTIYLLIVGTYTPFIWEGTESWFRLSLLVAVWSAAAFGFYSKVFAAYRVNAISTFTYLALGWLPAMALLKTTPWVCFLWMLLGGLSYSAGVVFLRQSGRIRYAHAAWHVMVLLGSACHFTAIIYLRSAA